MEDDFLRALIEIQAEEGLQSFDYTPAIRDDALRQKLALSRQGHQLWLVLGAGVSRPSGLDDWRTLIHSAAGRLFGSSALAEMTDALRELQLSYPIQVRFFETCAGLKAPFRSMLLDSLYRNFKPSARNETLDALCEIILGLDGGELIEDVITYNFDNLLEMALESKIRSAKLDLAVIPIYSPSGYTDSKRPKAIRIYHPHGFLPYNGDADLCLTVPLVFSEEDYHRNYFSDAYWANAIQLDSFSRYMCLFVGLSFSDGNLRRLLDYVRFRDNNSKKHSAIRRVISIAGAKPLPEYAIEKDLGSLGVSPIWLKDHNDIPAFLRAIR